jgi:Domain of unknown function (DUF4259)
MGAWGAGPFENDAALDFAAGIETPEDLAAALTLRTPQDEVDADLACRIIVVAECVSAMRGHWHKHFPEDLARKVEKFGPPSPSLFHHAVDHLSAATERGELVELWAEGDARAFNREVHNLYARLGRNPVGGKAGKRPKKKPVFNHSPCMFCNQPMGEEQFSQLTIHLDHGDGLPMGRGGFCHHECLNAALHPAHLIRAYPHDPSLSPDELDALLNQPPRAQ